MFNDLEKGTTIKFYSNWTDSYMIGDIVEKKDNGYKVSIKSRIAKEIFVEKNDISNVIDKTIKFEPIDEEVIEIPIIEESFEIPLIEDIVVEEPIEEEPIEEEPIVEEVIEKKPSPLYGMFANGGDIQNELISGLPNELTVFIPLFDSNETPVPDTEIENRVEDVKDFLERNFGEFIIQNLGSSYIDKEGNLVMRKTIQVTAHPTDDEFNYYKNELINQLSLWASEWEQKYMILEYEEDMFYILPMNDMMKRGGETWIQDAVNQMKKKGTIGAFTKQAKREGLTPIDFAKKVLKKPKGYTLKTRRRANFVKNVNPDKF